MMCTYNATSSVNKPSTDDMSHILHSLRLILGLWATLNDAWTFSEFVFLQLITWIGDSCPSWHATQPVKWEGSFSTSTERLTVSNSKKRGISPWVQLRQYNTLHMTFWLCIYLSRWLICIRDVVNEVYSIALTAPYAERYFKPDARNEASVTSWYAFSCWAYNWTIINAFCRAGEGDSSQRFRRVQRHAGDGDTVDEWIFPVESFEESWQRPGSSWLPWLRTERHRSRPTLQRSMIPLSVHSSEKRRKKKAPIQSLFS